MDRRMLSLMHYGKSKKGQGLVEYALIIGCVALCVVMVLRELPEPIMAIFTKILETLSIMGLNSLFFIGFQLIT